MENMELPEKFPLRSYYADNDSTAECFESTETIECPKHLALNCEDSKIFFNFFLWPIDVKHFLNEFWEKKPMRTGHMMREYYKNLITTPEIYKMLRQHNIEFREDIRIDINDEKIEQTPFGRASPPKVRQYYTEGCEIRIMNLQKFVPIVHSIIVSLEDYFKCKVDSNVYLSSHKYGKTYPPRCNSFETFVLQIEGAKHWCVYPPANRANILARKSKNIDPNQPPMENCILVEGDLLYIPRGCIYETSDRANSHSLHITITVDIQTCGDFFKSLFSKALEDAINNNVHLRRGLPLDIWQNLGSAHGNYSANRLEIISQINECLQTVNTYAMRDLHKAYQSRVKDQKTAIPPYLTEVEKSLSVYGTNTTFSEDGTPEYRYIGSNTKIRLIRKNLIHLEQHNYNTYRVYYSTENSIEHARSNDNYFNLETRDVPAVEALIKSHPQFVITKDLQLSSEERNVFVAQILWERGVLMTDKPLI